MQRGETVDLRELFSKAEPEAAGAHEIDAANELARIVRAATALQARRETLCAVRCLRPHRCRGFLSVRLQDIPPLIFWRCNRCSEAGKILNWPHTPWDLSHLANGFEGSPMGPLCEVPLAPKQYDSLLELRGCDEAFQKIIYSAVPRGKVIQLQGDLPDFLYMLERCIERSAASDDRPQCEALSQICASLEATIRDLERRRGHNGSSLTGDAEDMDLPGWLPPDLADRLRRALEDGHFSSIDDLNDQLALTMEAYNRRPSSELAGLSPYQASQLLGGDWNGSGALRLNAQLPVQEISRCPYYRNSRQILENARSEGGLPATARGNMNRRVVRELIQACEVDIPSMFQNLNEQDVLQLHIPRVICQLGGLLRRRGRKLLLTKKGERLLDPRVAGRLYCHLFKTFFRKFNLAYLDGSVDNSALQDTVAFSLYALYCQRPSWHSAKVLAPRILIPAAFEAALNLGDDQPTWQAYTRLLLPMYNFGLLEFRWVEKKSRRDRQFRLSPLFRQFVHFSIPK